MADLRMMHHSDGNVFNTSLSNTKLKSAQEKKKTLKKGFHTTKTYTLPARSLENFAEKNWKEVHHYFMHDMGCEIVERWSYVGWLKI
jgi:hypothetical protein